MPVDLALINANVITMNPKQPQAQAVAIKDGKVKKVGSTAQIMVLVGKSTRVIDLKGKTVVPGLIDTHVHVADFGRCLMWLDLTRAGSIAYAQKMLKAQAKQTATGKWIIGRGWNQEHFKEKRMLTCRDLDAAAPNNPVILYHEAAMIAAVNSRALELAKVSAQTTVPSGGTMDKVDGELTGILRDSATNLVWQAVPEPTEEEMLAATATACQKIVEAGLSSIHWLVLSENELPLIPKLAAQGKLPMRVNVVVPEALLQKALDLKLPKTSMLQLGGVLIWVDGYLDSKTAALTKPYSDEPNNCGKLLLDETALLKSVNRVLDADLQPIIHTMGDKAVETALQVIRKVGGDNLIRMEQAALLDPQLITQLKDQQVVVSIQPKVISTEFSVWSATQHLGVERAKWLHPLKSLVTAGVKVTGGSDCPMEPLSPLLGIQEATTREAFPEQQLSAMQALQMYTLDAAYCSGENELKGSVEEGKLADLTVLSSDPTATEREKIKNITVEMTIIDGKMAFSKP